MILLTKLEHKLAVVKIGLTAFVLMFCVVCMADPVMRTSRKRGPLQGKVKIVRSSGYDAMGPGEAESKLFDKYNYSVDSFSSAGLKLCTRWILRGEMIGWAEYKYDAKGNKIEESIYDEDMQLGVMRIFRYDASGHLEEERSYSAWDPRVFATKYVCIGGRLAIKERDSMERIVYSYNGIGQVVEETLISFHHPGKIVKQYKYDHKGRISSETQIFSLEALSTTYTFDYDEHDNQVLAEETANDGLVIRRTESEYAYDSHGNWICCLEDAENDFPTPKRLSLREIEYY